MSLTSSVVVVGGVDDDDEDDDEDTVSSITCCVSNPMHSMWSLIESVGRKEIEGDEYKGLEAEEEEEVEEEEGLRRCWWYTMFPRVSQQYTCWSSVTQAKRLPKINFEFCFFDHLSIAFENKEYCQ